MYFASFPSVLYLFKSTIGKLSPRIMMLSSSVSSGSWSISPSFGFSSGSCLIGWYPPPSLFALLLSSASISAISSRLFRSVGMARKLFSGFGGRIGVSVCPVWRKHFSAPPTNHSLHFAFLPCTPLGGSEKSSKGIVYMDFYLRSTLALVLLLLILLVLLQCFALIDSFFICYCKSKCFLKIFT